MLRHLAVQLLIPSRGSGGNNSRAPLGTPELFNFSTTIRFIDIILLLGIKICSAAITVRFLDTVFTLRIALQH